MMENILSYVSWRGDLTFSEREFNEVDALIFSVIGYMEWDGIVGEEEVLLGEACKMYLKHHHKKTLDKQYVYSPKIPELMRQLHKSKRYKDIILKHYISRKNEEIEVQFAAVTIIVGSIRYIAYRGTDSTILGWKEDLNMTYLDEVPSQRMAREYLLKVAKDIKEASLLPFFKKKAPQLILGGHSKGGNLAMYAAICEKALCPQINKVYNFDGPGFRSGFYEQNENNEIMKKIVTYLPEESIIGRLLVHKEKAIIIQGYELGLMQHDPFCWKCEAKKFAYAKHLSEASDKTIEYIDTLLLSKEDTKKEEFITMLFRVLKDLEITKVSDFSELSLKQGISGIKELSNMSSEDRKMFLDCIKLLWGQAKPMFLKK